MNILLYRGTGLISKAIQFQTRSKYSHVAAQHVNGEVIEAWHTGGVRKIPDPFYDHASTTLIDVYKVNEGFDAGRFWNLLETQIGCDYDFKSVARFLTRKEPSKDKKWFCSELICWAFNRVGRPILHGNPSELSPRDVSKSPLLDFQRTITERNSNET